jgi:Na+/melibiose symporter-like transporter
MPSLNFVRYGGLGFALAILGIPLYVYLPTYYAQQSSLSLTAVGSALLLARTLDVITDPLIGWWSDRLNPTFSRFKQMILASGLLLVGVYQLWLPNLAEFSWWQLFFWSFITYLAWTAVAIPYLAMSAEISRQAHHKTLLASSREGFAIIGVLLVLSLPLISGLDAQAETFYSLLFTLFGVTLIAGLLLLIKLPMLPIVQIKTTMPIPPWKLLQQLWQQERQVFHIMPSYFLNNFANALPATLFLLFVSDYLQLASQTGLFLFIYFVAGLVSLPIWIKLAKRFGKQRTWQASMLLASLSFIGVFFLEPGEANGFILVSILTGLSLGIDVAMPASIQSDLTQTVKSQQTSGLLFGLWGMLTKLALALAVGLSFPIIEWSQNFSLQSDTAINLPTTTLLILYAGLPIVLKLFAWFLLNRLSSTPSPA